MRKYIKYIKYISYVLLMVVYIVIAYKFVTTNNIINSAAAEPYECTQANIIMLYDCAFTDDNGIELLGPDPYIVMSIPVTDVGVVSVDVIENYTGSYRIYYAMDGAFGEDKIALRTEEWPNVFIVGETINTFRVDIEGFTETSFHLVDEFKVTLNANIEEIANNFKSALSVCALYMIVSAIYMFILLLKNRFVGIAMTYVYNILILYVWVLCISMRIDMFVNVLILLIASAGMLFWGKCTALEEWKWIKE